MPDAFFLPDGDDFIATEMTRGPWDNRFQHGGPPAALFATAMAELGDEADEYEMTRLSVELLRPVPIGRMTVDCRFTRRGRAVQRLEATLSADGKVVMTATGLRQRRSPIDIPPARPLELWPDPTDLAPYAFTFFQHEVGYHRAVDLRVAHGAWGTTPVGFWARVRIPVVQDREDHPFAQLVLLADAQSGMGVPLDPRRFTFLNPDLTVYVARPPAGPWFGFDIRSYAGPLGAGLAESALRDVHGELGRSAQSLVVAARSD